MAQLTSCRINVAFGTVTAATTIARMTIQGIVASRSRAVRAITCLKRGTSAGGAMPDVTKYGINRVMTVFARPSARMKSGSATSRRTCTP